MGAGVGDGVGSGVGSGVGAGVGVGVGEGVLPFPLAFPFPLLSLCELIGKAQFVSDYFYTIWKGINREQHSTCFTLRTLVLRRAGPSS